ncbi:MAG: DUF1294 domain-containing protein [Clostridia bacterium]|nr:DUF1294 domain-containing protein [Clostridia bacterium]
MDHLHILTAYLIFIAVVSVSVTIYDKLAAKKSRQRVSENTLMALGLMGGAAPMLITMLIIRHKTRHLKFMLGLPAEIILQLAVVWAVFFR